jgi:phosphatidylserine/phosphatidylglycerophosphate/cardiolipin synthase-like enzyme
MSSVSALLLPPESAHVPPLRRSCYPLRTGNAVRPLVDGAPAFRRICEAVEAARESVWLTVAYLDRDVAMPDGRGSLFDLLERAALRRIAVRLLFWREPRLHELEPESTHFPGDASDRAWLAEHAPSVKARWDRHPQEFCHHQKSWIVDAGGSGEVAFVGGINLLHSSICQPGHPPHPGGQDHDVYVEVAGPAATDVHHNFVQRWNEASERARPDGCWPDAARAADLEFPAFLSPAAGEIPVQMTRTIAAGLYAADDATPGAKPYPIADGERSVLEQYLAAIDAARSSIYVEDQVIGSPAIVDALQAAVERAVEVVFLVPGNAHPAFVAARRDPRAGFFFDKLARLGAHDRFTLAAIAASRPGGHYDEIYVHAKLMLIDDAWGTIGSTNVADRSFQNDTELNASFWHPPTVRALRETLLGEHLGVDTAGWDDRKGLRLFREIALANRARRGRRAPLAGLAYAVDATTYGVTRP